jgi:hypothetical protein
LSKRSRNNLQRRIEICKNKGPSDMKPFGPFDYPSM